jgi:hypothetical protein
VHYRADISRTVRMDLCVPEGPSTGVALLTPTDDETIKTDGGIASFSWSDMSGSWGSQLCGGNASHTFDLYVGKTNTTMSLVGKYTGLTANVALANADEAAGHRAAEGPERVGHAFGDRHVLLDHLELDDHLGRRLAVGRRRHVGRARQHGADRRSLRRCLLAAALGRSRRRGRRGADADAGAAQESEQGERRASPQECQPGFHDGSFAGL